MAQLELDYEGIKGRITCSADEVVRLIADLAAKNIPVKQAASPMAADVSTPKATKNLRLKCKWVGVPKSGHDVVDFHTVDGEIQISVDADCVSYATDPKDETVCTPLINGKELTLISYYDHHALRFQTPQVYSIDGYVGGAGPKSLSAFLYGDEMKGVRRINAKTSMYEINDFSSVNYKK